MRRTTPLIFSCVVLLFSYCAVGAQNPVSWNAKANPQKVTPGGKLTVQATAQIDGGWHMYSITQGAGGPIPTKISIPDGQSFKLAGGISGPRPKVQLDPNFNINTETYEGSATFSIPVTVDSAASPGAGEVQITIRFQVCNETTCLPPKTVKISAPVEVVAAGTIAQVVPSPSPSPSVKPSPSPIASPSPSPSNVNGNANNGENSAITVDTEPTPSPSASANSNISQTVSTKASNTTSLFGASKDASLWSFIWLAISVGALSLLTPCVFPMVPITVSYFTNHAAGKRSTAVRDAFIYALGIILTFTALGVALAVIFGAAGINKFAASPYVNIVISIIFLSFAFSLFGAYNLQVPSSVLTKIDAFSRNKESSRVIGLLLMGLTFSLTSFTCTAPFVGSLLVLAAQGQKLYPVIGMLAFSTVFALPFFILALAPQLVSQLPKSGGWLNSVKVVMGLLEVAAAMKFISNVDLVWQWGIFTREVVLAVWVGVAVLIALYLLGRFQLTHDTEVGRIGALRLLISLISLSLGLYLLTGLFGARLGGLEAFLPPPAEGSNAKLFSNGNGTSGAQSDELTWITNDYEAGLKKAREENKPVFIDFTGYTCTNCRWMEANMFTRGTVKAELEKYIRVRLYTDGEGEVYEKQQQMQQDKFGTVALPFYAVVDGNGQSITNFPGLTRDVNEFVSFLQNGQAKNGATASLNKGDVIR